MLADAALFSRQFGQDHGFEWFEEAPVATWDLAQTIAKADQRMAADDGRPLFLVVHTYRVHVPLRVGPEEDGKPWMLDAAEALEREGKGGHRPEFVASWRRLLPGSGRRPDPEARRVDGLAGAPAGFFERGVLALTSDHGNAYGEHGEIGHGGDLYDVKLRVPLFFVGRGLAPRAVSGVVSLIDVAPTLAALARVDPARLAGTLAARGRTAAAELRLRPQVVPPAGRAVRGGPQADRAQRRRAARGQPEPRLRPRRGPGRGAEPRDHAVARQRLGRALAEQLEPLLVPTSGAEELELPPDVQQQLEVDRLHGVARRARARRASKTPRAVASVLHPKFADKAGGPQPGWQGAPTTRIHCNTRRRRNAASPSEGPGFVGELRAQDPRSPARSTSSRDAQPWPRTRTKTTSRRSHRSRARRASSTGSTRRRSS